MGRRSDVNGNRTMTSVLLGSDTSNALGAIDSVQTSKKRSG